MDTREELYSACEAFINNKLKTVQDAISNIQDSLLSESKSTAGDKHETGRAMLQLEREKAGKQLAETEKLKEFLGKIKNKTQSQRVSLGSVVHTTKANYYIAISAGEIIIENAKFYAISPQAPMAQSMMSKTVGDEVCFREQIFKIEKVL